MKKKGFTLIELLAVIVVLAIIALIATPIVMNVIENSKKESTRLSVEHYLDAVELAIAQERIDTRNNLDGTYTITEEGKKLVQGDIEIPVDYRGDALYEGSLEIQDGVVTKINGGKAGKTKKWFAVLMLGRVKLLDKLPESDLTTGEKFSISIKSMTNNSSTIQKWTADTSVTSIEFLSYGSLPAGKTLEDLQTLQDEGKYVDVSAAEDESIIALYDEGKVYVYSEDLIVFNTDSSYMLCNFQKLENVNFGMIDTSAMTNMIHFFRGDSSLTKLDLTSFDTNNVTTMESLFSSCSKLTEIKFGDNFKTNEVTNMREMFSFCSNLTTLDLINFNTENVTNMYNMFWGCSALENLNIISFNTSNVEDMGGLFGGCKKLTEIKFGENFKTNKVKNMYQMFYQCNGLTSIDLSDFNTENVEDMRDMFSGCSSLTSLNLKPLNTAKVTQMDGMFSHCDNLETIDLSGFNTSSVRSMSYMFTGCDKLNNIIWGENFKTGNVGSMYGMFSGCKSLTELDLSTFDTGKVTNMIEMFAFTKQLTNIKFGENFKTDNVSDMRYMFREASSLTQLDLSKFNTTKVKSMTGMFYDCTNLERITFGENFKAGIVTTMEHMFSGCKSLTELDLSTFDTTMLNTTRSMFKNCENLTEITFEKNFKTDKVTDMYGMFSGCKSLTDLDLSTFNTSNVGTMWLMFYQCENLKNVNLSSFTTEKLNKTSSMFEGCKNLQLVDFSNANFNGVSDKGWMFSSGVTANITVLAGQEEWMQARCPNCTITTAQ